MRGPKCLSLSYEQITPISPEELQRLATLEILDDETLARIAHLARCFKRICELVPDGAAIEDVMTEEEAQAIFLATADPGDDPSDADPNVGAH
jgi:hypothetical protein